MTILIIFILLLINFNTTNSFKYLAERYGNNEIIIYFNNINKRLGYSMTNINNITNIYVSNYAIEFIPEEYTNNSIIINNIIIHHIPKKPTSIKINETDFSEKNWYYKSLPNKYNFIIIKSINFNLNEQLNINFNYNLL